MKEININDILTLSIPERILLVEDIWDTIASKPNDDIEFTDDEKKIIDQRLEAYSNNPDGVSEWKDVYSRIIKTNETTLKALSEDKKDMPTFNTIEELRKDLKERKLCTL